MTQEFDLLIIGGGINGAGIARDAAGRGLSVCLVEQADLASGTSSASTKMIHGGLRYLEYYEFGLVRQALKEREVLLKIAPHLIQPLRIILPILPKMRPAWLIRLGLWIYDHLGGKISLPITSTLSLTDTPEGAALKAGPTKAFAYSDGWVDDARLVVLNAVDAAKMGAKILTNTKLNALQCDQGKWLAELTSNGSKTTCIARSVINAAGPWADKVDGLAGLKHAAHMVKVQGSHIVLPKLYDGEHAYLFQNPDGRVLFAIPFQGDYTLFGTTDTPITDDPAKAQLTTQETEYLLRGVSRFFKHDISEKDIVWSYSGVRALFGDPKKSASALSRDYELLMDKNTNTPAFLSILGGKVTTYRKLSEKAVTMISAQLGNNAEPWTATKPLPGGDFGNDSLSDLIARTQQQYPFFDKANAIRLAKAYGTLVFDIFAAVKSKNDLGIDFGCGFSEVEVRYLIKNEFASTVDDLIWGRSKIGMHLSKSQVKKLQDWLLTLEHI